VRRQRRLPAGSPPVLHAGFTKAELTWQIAVSGAIISLIAVTVSAGFDAINKFGSFSELLLRSAWIAVQFSSLVVTATMTLDSLLSVEIAQDEPALPSSRKVSVHVPIHREPVDVVSATLHRLAAVKYEAFEVIVVDNNTPEQQLWRPIESLSEELGFRFFHLERWPGHKAGALNFAAEMTSADADFIAILDADYLVEPDFLTKLMARFNNSNIAFVQAPQDYRYDCASTYQSSCYFAYRYFFDVNMTARKRMNSIIFVGTMGIIRKAVLVESGGWDEQCLTEDAEMGLRVAAHGYVGSFVNTSYGRGIMPLDYLSLRSQRNRWAYGAAQMFRKYWPVLLGIKQESKVLCLSRVQRYGFSCFFLNWFDAWIVVGTIFLFWMTSLLYICSNSIGYSPVPTTYALLAILTFGVRCMVVVGSTMRRTRCAFVDACRAHLVLNSLNWIISCACFAGIRSRSAQFVRTPKHGPSGDSLLRKLCHLLTEIALAVTSFAIGSILVLFAGTDMIATTYAAGCFFGGFLFLSSVIVLVVDHRENVAACVQSRGCGASPAD
jgi:cellulose synthase/poly-beta-1,6-N-acetylglucosamine synthase-like glycosyltransferase